MIPFKYLVSKNVLANDLSKLQPSYLKLTFTLLGRLSIEHTVPYFFPNMTSYCNLKFYSFKEERL